MNKITVISGGTSGLGLEIAELMVKAGKTVLILGRNKDKLAKALARLRNSVHGNHAGIACNIGNEDDVTRIGKFIADNDYTVEYLFNNAGTGLFRKAEESTGQLIDEVFAANLKGMILLTTRVLNLTPAASELTIINVMSTSAQIGRADETLYCAAKFGARGYTEALRAEFKGKKRNIIAVYPGGMKTDFWNMAADKDLSGFMDPANVAGKIVNAVLLSDKMLVTDITINRR